MVAVPPRSKPANSPGGVHENPLPSTGFPPSGEVDAVATLEMVLGRIRELPSVRVPIEIARGRVLTRPIIVDRDQPPYDRATTDGFAVRASDRDRWVTVVGETMPGQSPSGELGPGEAIIVTTGTCCPPGTEAVVPTSAVAVSLNSILLPPVLTRGHNVVRKGQERSQGAVLVPSGAKITPPVIAAAATVGLTSFEVVRRPNIRVVSTGDEVRSSLDEVDDSSVRDANGPMLMSMLDDLVDVPPRLSVVGDDLEVIQEALHGSLAADVVIFSGGMSDARYGRVRAALESAGANVVVRGLQDEPGERFLFATMGGTLILALPGQPIAAHRCAHRFVVPALRKLMGLPPAHLEGEGRLVGTIAPSHPRLVPARVETGPDGVSVNPLDEAWSPSLFTPIQANVYVNLPAGAPWPADGDIVRFQWMAPGP